MDEGAGQEAIVEEGDERVWRSVEPTWRKQNENLYAEARRGRLARRLFRAGVQGRATQGGGDCQFYAISDALKRAAGREVTVDLLRVQAANWLELNVDDASIVPMRIGFLDNRGDEELAEIDDEEIRKKFLEACEDLRGTRGGGGKWGDQFSLLALATVHNMSVTVISDDLGLARDGDDDGRVIITPLQRPPEFNITLSLSGVDRNSRHYESTEERSDNKSADAETMRRARTDIDRTLGELLRSRNDAQLSQRITKIIAMDVTAARMKASPERGDDEPQSPPILAGTSKRAAQFHVSPSYTASDAQHERSPGGTVRDSRTGRVCPPFRRAKPRITGNMFSALADEEDYEEEEEEEEEEEVAVMREKFGGTISFKDWQRDTHNLCRVSRKLEKPPPALAVKFSDSREPSSRQFVGPAVPGTVKQMFDENDEIRRVMEKHFTHNLSPVLEEFVVDKNEWLGDGENMSTAMNAMFRFLDTLECFPLVGFKNAFDPRDANDATITSFFQEIARLPGWMRDAPINTPINTLSGEVIGEQCGDADHASIGADLMATSTWHHTYFSTKYIPMFFTQQFYAVGETLVDESVVPDLISELKRFANWSQSQECRDPENDLRGRMYDEPTNTYIWLVRSGVGAYVGESQRQCSVRLGHHRSGLISGGGNAQRGHIRARNEMLVRLVDFTLSGNPTKCWQPVVDTHVSFHVITHPTRRRMGRLLNAFMDFVLEYRKTHESNKPEYVCMPALAALGAFEGFFTEIVWTFWLKTWIKLSSPWALNWSVPGERPGRHRRGMVASIEYSHGFATTPWVMRCHEGDADSARTALQTMHGTVVTRYTEIFGAAGVSMNLVKKLLNFFIPNYWNHFGDLLTGAEVVSNGSAPSSMPTRSLTARFFGGDERECNFNDGVFCCLFRDLLRIDANGKHVRALIDSLGNKAFLESFLGEAPGDQSARYSAKTSVRFDIWLRNAHIILPSEFLVGPTAAKSKRVMKKTTKAPHPGDVGIIGRRLFTYWIQHPQALRSLLELISLAQGTPSTDVHSAERVELDDGIDDGFSKMLGTMLRSRGTYWKVSTYITWLVRFWRNRAESTNKQVDASKLKEEDFAYNGVSDSRLQLHRLIFGILFAAANGESYTAHTTAMYKEIAAKYVRRPEATAQTATLADQDIAILEKARNLDIAILEKARNLIVQHTKKSGGRAVWTELEDAVVVFVVAALAEKGGGTGAMSVDIWSVEWSKDMQYVCDTMERYVHADRTTAAIRSHWGKLLREDESIALRSYADALKRLQDQVAEYERRPAVAVVADRAATLTDQDDIAILEKARNLIVQNTQKKSGNTLWTELEDAVVVFVVAALAEKGGGTGAMSVDRWSNQWESKDMQYVCDTIERYVHADRNTNAIQRHWGKLLREDKSIALCSYADALKRLQDQVVKYSKKKTAL